MAIESSTLWPATPNSNSRLPEAYLGFYGLREELQSPSGPFRDACEGLEHVGREERGPVFRVGWSKLDDY